MLQTTSFIVFDIAEGAEITYPENGASFFIGDVMHTKYSTSGGVAGVKLEVRAPDGSTVLMDHDADGVFYPVANQVGEWILTPYYSQKEEEFLIESSDGKGKSVSVNVTGGNILIMQGTTADAADAFQDIDGEIISVTADEGDIITTSDNLRINGRFDHPIEAVRIYSEGQLVGEITDTTTEEGGLIIQRYEFIWKRPASSSGCYSYSFVPVNSK